MNQVPRVSLSPLLLPAGGGAIALVFSLVADIGPINPEFFALVAQILPLLLLATLIEPRQTALYAQRPEAPIPSVAAGREHAPTDLTTEETDIDPAELEGLDLDELMATVMPKIEAAQAKLEEVEERRVRAQEESDKAERDLDYAKRHAAFAKAHYARVRRRATLATRVAIWAMFPGEAAALYAVASRQYTTFLAIFCSLSVLTTFWLVAETWISRTLSERHQKPYAN